MKKSVMTRAWEIFRTLVGDRIAKLSQALKMAWEEVKNVAKKVVTPFTSGEAVTVDGFYYTVIGCFTNPFTVNCLDATYNDGVLTLNYARDLEWGEVCGRGKKEVKFTVEHGFIDGKVINMDLANECVKEIKGKTYDIKNTIKEYGFKWNKESKSWVR